MNNNNDDQDFDDRLDSDVENNQQNDNQNQEKNYPFPDNTLGNNLFTYSLY